MVVCRDLGVVCGDSMLPQGMVSCKLRNMQATPAISFSAVDIFCGWCTAHIMLVKSSVPKNQMVYRYDHHVENLITVVITLISIVHRGRPIYFLLIYHYWYKVNGIISAFHKHIKTESLFYISVIMCL